MPKSSFTKYLAFLLFANLLIKPIYIFGIETQAQNLLGTNTWGLYFGLLNFCFLFQIILDPGIHNQNTKWVAENRGNLSKRIGQTIIMKLWLGILFLFVLGIVGSWIGYPSSYYKLLGMIALNFFLSSFYVFLKSHFPAMGDYGKETLFSVLDKILLIIIVGVQIYVLKDLSIESFILSITAANIIAILIAYNRVRKITRIQFYFSTREAFSILKESFGFALVGLFMSLFNRMDGVMLERMLDDEAYASGVYAAGYRILDASNMFALLFASLLLPMFAYRLHKDGEVGQLAAQAAKIMLVIVSMVVLSGYFYAEQIMNLLYVDYTQQYADSFRILILSFIGVGFSYIYGTLITATGKLLIFNIVLFGGICINWYLNYQWIPLETSIGAAKATLITQVSVMILQFLLVLKSFGLKSSLNSMISVILYIILAVSMSYFISQIEIHWMIKLAGSIIIMIIASFLMGLIRLDTFNNAEVD